MFVALNASVITRSRDDDLLIGKIHSICLRIIIQDKLPEMPGYYAKIKVIIKQAIRQLKLIGCSELSGIKPQRLCDCP